jgi:hypothetical protein
MRSPLALIAIALVLAALATACGPAPTPTPTPSGLRQVAMGVAFDIGVGEGVEVSGQGVTLHLAAVPADSRCPASVTCVWAGEAALAIGLTTRELSRDVTLTVSAEGVGAVEVSGYRVRALALEPYPQEPGVIPQADYRATLVVERP